MHRGRKGRRAASAVEQIRREGDRLSHSRKGDTSSVVKERVSTTNVEEHFSKENCLKMETLLALFSFSLSLPLVAMYDPFQSNVFIKDEMSNTVTTKTSSPLWPQTQQQQVSEVWRKEESKRLVFGTRFPPKKGFYQAIKATRRRREERIFRFRPQ